MCRQISLGRLNVPQQRRPRYRASALTLVFVKVLIGGNF